MRILKFLAMVAAAATLAGCGGGGGGTAATGSDVSFSPDFWTIPSAPTTNPVGNITTSGNMAFRFVESNGGAQTVQAAVNYASGTSVVTFDPLTDGDRLVVTENLSVTTATLNNRSINLLTDGMGNAIVGCANPGTRPATRADTVVFLSHNLRPVTLAEASVGANSIVGQTFNEISCPAAAMGVSGGHQEWFQFNSDGTISLGDAATTSPAQALPAADFAAMLTREGLVSPGTGTRNRGQIYELTINGNRMLFILMHTTENGVHDVVLWIPGSERPNGGGDDVSPAAVRSALEVTNLSSLGFPWMGASPGVLKRWELPIPVKLGTDPRAIAAVDEIERQLGQTIFDRTSIASVPNDQITRGLIVSIGTSFIPPGATDPCHGAGGVAAGPNVGHFPTTFLIGAEFSARLYINLDNSGCVASQDVTTHEFGHAMGMAAHFEGFGHGSAISPLFWRVLQTMYANPIGTTTANIAVRP